MSESERAAASASGPDERHSGWEVLALPIGDGNTAHVTSGRDGLVTLDVLPGTSGLPYGVILGRESARRIAQALLEACDMVWDVSDPEAPPSSGR